jgi:fucose 4-O-acetylase-like acetyltransferase
MENASDTKAVRRIEWVDLIKGIAIYLVVVGHVLIYTFHRDSGRLLSFIYSFHMPLFMFVGGYVAQLKYNKAMWSGFPKYLWTKFVALVVPYVVWGVLVWNVMDRYNWLSLGACGKFLTECVDIVIYYKGLWFLLAFFSLSIGFYLVCVVLKKSKSGGVISLVLLALIYLCLFKLTGNLLWKISLQYIPVFGLGCWMCGSEKVYGWLTAKKTFNWVLPCFLIAASYYQYEVNNWMKMVVGLLSAPTFVWLCQHLEFGERVKGWLLKLGNRSLSIYCMQGFFFAFLPYGFGDDLYQGMVAIVLGVVISSLCVWVTTVLEKSTVLNCLLFGRLPKKNS